MERESTPVYFWDVAGDEFLPVRGLRRGGVCGSRGHFKVEGQTLLQFELAQEERDCLGEGQSQLRTDLPGASFELWLDACGDYRGSAHGGCS